MNPEAGGTRGRPDPLSPETHNYGAAEGLWQRLHLPPLRRSSIKYDVRFKSSFIYLYYLYQRCEVVQFVWFSQDFFMHKLDLGKEFKSELLLLSVYFGEKNLITSC